MGTNDLAELGSEGFQSDRARSRPSHYFFPSLSIRQRLPLMMAILLSGIIVASTWASYIGVRDSALEVGRERLTHLTEQLAGILQQSSVTLIGKPCPVANDPAIRSYLQVPSDRTRPAAVTLLRQLTDQQDPSSTQIELWNADHSF